METQTQTQTTTQTRDVQTYEFNADQKRERADIFIGEIFTDRWGTPRAVLAGETYDAKEAIKANWPVMHHKPGEDARGKFAWIIDATDESFDALDAAIADLIAEEKLPEGFDFDRTDRKAVAHAVDPDSEFGRLVLAASQDDPIAVVYQKKNGNGPAEKVGTVSGIYGEEPSGYLTEVEGPEDLEDLTKITIGINTEDSHYRIHNDDSGKLSIFSSGYFPYMGAVESVTLSGAN